MKKTLLAFLLLLLSLIFAGCADIQFDCGVDEDYNAYLKYDITLDTASLEAENTTLAKATLNRLQRYCETNLEVEVDSEQSDTTGIYSLRITKTVPNKSYGEAFEALEEMLTDEKLTPFLNLTMESKDTKYEHGYYFSAEADLSKIIETANMEDQSPAIKEYFEKSIEDITGSFRVSLPATRLFEDTAELSGGIASCQSPWSLDKPVKLCISAGVSDGQVADVSADIAADILKTTADDGSGEADVFSVISNAEGLKGKYLNVLYIAGSAGAVFFVVLIVLLVSGRKKKRSAETDGV